MSTALPKTIGVSDRTDIQVAIRTELDKASKACRFVVKQAERHGDVVTLEIDQAGSKDGLKENLEESTAIWKQPKEGSGQVLSVEPERGRLHLRNVIGQLPEADTTVFVHAPRYLEALKEAWEDNDWFQAVSAWYNRDLSKPEFVFGRGLPIAPSTELRERQQMVFQLPAWSTGFVHGPPGTGKTYTIGAMLAQMLLTRPDARVLLISTTNTAVDQALISVDKALSRERRDVRLATSVRNSLCRVGSNFKASEYVGRSHLIPANDQQLLDKLAKLEAARPPLSSVQEYAAWKREVQTIRLQLKQQLEGLLRTKRLLALTATSATYQFEVLRASAPFDYVLFDEASQLAAAQAMILAPLGKAVAFAGDPCQLAPIQLCDTPRSRQWLGTSIFERMSPDKNNCVVLNEQSRMSEDICRVVSKVFYNGVLKVAKDAETSPTWRRERQLRPAGNLRDFAVIRSLVKTEGEYNYYLKGPCRIESAKCVASTVETLLNSGMQPDEILVLTPFHAQRSTIRSQLSQKGIGKIQVATVHSVQGTEKHTVIFDPVQGNDTFFRDEMGGDRLVNVAISRAKARLILVFSPGDRGNPTIDKIARMATSTAVADSAPTVQEWKQQPNYPHCMVQQRLSVKDRQGVVVRVELKNDIVVLLDSELGIEKRYTLSILEGRAATRDATNPGVAQQQVSD